MADGSKIGTSVIFSTPGQQWTMLLTLSFECRVCSFPLSLDDDVDGLPLGDAIRGGGEDGGGPGGGGTGRFTASRGDVVAGMGEPKANADTGDCVT